MSSVTSTEAAAVQGSAMARENTPERARPASGEGFQPWHFFVLASLLLATVAVIMSRRSSPEHLLLISFTIGAAGAAAAGFYRTLAPLMSRDVEQFRETLSTRSRQALEREKTLVLRSIKELEFDRAMGKLSDSDFEELGGRLRSRAIALMKQLDDEGGSAYRLLIERELKARMQRGHTRTAALPLTVPVSATVAPETRPEPPSDVAVFCTACGTAADTDARFCKRCGTRLQKDDPS